jgi:large subunit ribosomal protein L10
MSIRVPMVHVLLCKLLVKGGLKPLNREGKEHIVSHLSDKLREASLVVLTDYRGLSVEKITQLRNELRSVSSDYRVAKNTLLKRASQGTDLEQLNEYFTGPTAILVSQDDPIAPVKVLVKYLKDYSELSIKAGFLQGTFLSAEDTQALSTLPGRNELLGKLLSLLVSSQVRLLNALSGVPQKLVRVLRAIEQSKAE